MNGTSSCPKTSGMVLRDRDRLTSIKRARIGRETSFWSTIPHVKGKQPSFSMNEEKREQKRKTTLEINNVVNHPFPLEIWRLILNFSHVETILNFWETASAFKSLTDNTMYKKMYLYRWRDYFDEDRMQGLIYEGPSNFVDSQYSNLSNDFWYRRFLYRDQLKSKEINRNDLKALAENACVDNYNDFNPFAVFDLTKTMGNGLREGIIIGPSATPVQIRTKIQEANEDSPCFFKAFVFSYKTKSWCTLFYTEAGDEDVGYVTPTFQAITSLLFGKCFGDYDGDVLRDTIYAFSHADDNQSHYNTINLVKDNDPSMEYLFKQSD